VPAKSAISSRRSWHSGSNRSTFRFSVDTWNPLRERCSRTLGQLHTGSVENSTADIAGRGQRFAAAAEQGASASSPATEDESRKAPMPAVVMPILIEHAAI
jgi:hypothetical protein